VVFFIVLTSALIQGWSIPAVARWLNVDERRKKQSQYPIEFAPLENVDTQLVDLQVPFNSTVIGKSIIELGMPHDSLVVLINRDDNFIVPSGGTHIEEGDTLLVLVNNSNLPIIRSILSKQKEKQSTSVFPAID
jgi:cell volume regulation protein A